MEEREVPFFVLSRTLHETRFIPKEHHRTPLRRLVWCTGQNKRIVLYMDVVKTDYRINRLPVLMKDLGVTFDSWLTFHKGKSG
jgi:hypothetical protein